MPLVFIVFCSSEDSHSNIEHSTVHEMQCIKKASGKIYNMQYFRIEEQHKFWQCMCSATRTVLMLLHNEYFYFLQMKYIQHAVHHMYKWVAINMGRYHKYITDCIYNQLVVLFYSLNKGFFFSNFSQQRLNSRLSMCFTTMRMKDLTYSNQHVYKLEISFRQRINKSTLTPMSLKLVILKLLSREGLSCLN